MTATSSRRHFLGALGKTAIGGSAVLALTRLGFAAAPARRRPNIVIILADDLGYGDLGGYGGKTPTPHLDALAKGGLRFTDFHSSGAVCSPTRAGLLTGRYQQRAGIMGVLTAANHRKEGLSTGEVTFAELLKQAGYATAIFGKWHLGYDPKFNPVRHGFDEFRGYVSGNVDYISHVDNTAAADWWHNDQLEPEEGYTTHLITKHAVEFIERNKEQPFCLYVAHEAVHEPYQLPGDKPQRIAGEKTASPKRQRALVGEIYAGMLRELDKGVGEIVSTLERLALEKDTLVFFFSDNGATAAGSNGPLNGYKNTLWEGGHRVPAIAYWPGRIEGGRQTGETAICLDLFPTLLALAGVKAPENRKLDGANLLPLLTDSQSLGERTLFWANANQRAVRQGPWKLLLPVTAQEAGAMLFNLPEDPAEKNDLAKKEPERLAAMLKNLRAWEKEVMPKVESTQQEKAKERLRPASARQRKRA